MQKLTSITDLTGPRELSFALDQQSILEQSWLEQLSKSLDEEFDSISVFYRPRGYNNHRAHVDLLYTGQINTAALNFVIQDDTHTTTTSQMVWYPSPDNMTVKPSIEALAGPYASWSIDQLGKPLDTMRLVPNQLYLVRTDVPHTVDMQLDEPARWCISIRGKTLRTRAWHKTVDKLYIPND